MGSFCGYVRLLHTGKASVDNGAAMLGGLLTERRFDSAPDEPHIAKHRDAADSHVWLPTWTVSRSAAQRVILEQGGAFGGSGEEFEMLEHLDNRGKNAL